MKVLSDERNADVIAWTSSGTAFRIENSKKFVSDILPRHFKNAKFSSFTRKLHRWGFMRHYRGEDAGAFYHPDFIKDRLDLVEKMTCHKPISFTDGKSRKPKTTPEAAPPVPRPVAALGQPSPPLVTRPIITAGLPLVAEAVPSVAQIALREQQRVFDLNAAIEIEVARRLNERIATAALNQQAMAFLQQEREAAQLMQQQQAQPSVLDPRYLSLLQQTELQRRIQQLAAGPPPSQGQLNKGYETQRIQLPTNVGSFGAERGLPPTNIQSAKTA
jgi:hypothetical protein